MSLFLKPTVKNPLLFMRDLFLIQWKTGWVAQPFFSLLLNFPFYGRDTVSPSGSEAGGDPGALGLMEALTSRAVCEVAPSVRWRGQLLSYYTDVVPECFKMRMFVYRVVYLKQFPHDAMHLEKETLSDESLI